MAGCIGDKSGTFRFVSDPEDRYSCASVCKKWLLLQSHLPAGSEEVEPGDLRRTLEGKRANDVRLDAAALGTLGRGGLGKLVIRGGPKQRLPVANIGMLAVGACCRSLKVLSLWDCSSVNNVGFSSIGHGCKQLQVLNVLNCPGFGDAALQAIAAGCPLQNLSLEHRDRVSNKGLEAVAANCSGGLSALSLVSCEGIQDAGVISITAKCGRLKALRLDKLGLTDASLAFVWEQGKSIVKLKLAHLDSISKIHFDKMEQLKQLTVASCVGLDGGRLPRAFWQGKQASEAGTYRLQVTGLRQSSVVRQNIRGIGRFLFGEVQLGLSRFSGCSNSNRRQSRDSEVSDFQSA